MIINPFVFAVAGGGGGVTWNPADKGAEVTLSNGDLTAAGTSPGVTGRATASHSTGKYYYEVKMDVVSSGNGWPLVGIGDASITYTNSVGYGSAGIYSTKGEGNYTYRNGAYQPTGAFTVVNDVVMIACDLTALKIWFGRNGTYFLSGNPSAGTNHTWTLTSATYFPLYHVRGTQITARFASASWTYAAPTGFLEW